MDARFTRARRLAQGDLVGVVAPSGPVEAERLARGMATLQRLGLRVSVPQGIETRTGFSAGSVERRRSEIAAVLAQTDVRALFCARGGAGVIELLPLLEDLAPLVADPRPLLGCSDITLLHLVLNGQGVVTFHGPMVARGLDGAFDEDSFRWALMGEGQRYAAPPGLLRALADGEAEGPLLGGCLSLLAAASGTPWALRPPDGTVLLVEDIGEAPYRVHRMLWQLRLAGMFENVRGVVFGEMPGCEDPGHQTPLQEAIRRGLDGLGLPVAIGLPTGHTSGPGVTLPLGVTARLTCAGDEARFEMLDDGVQ
jgi:muramoyltetrapeptide carboxypeptidase